MHSPPFPHSLPLDWTWNKTFFPTPSSMPLTHWIQGQERKPFFTWIYGPSGSGKTHFALLWLYQNQELLLDQHQSFFFHRHQFSLGDPSDAFPPSLVLPTHEGFSGKLDGVYWTLPQLLKYFSDSAYGWDPEKPDPFLPRGSRIVLDLCPMNHPGRILPDLPFWIEKWGWSALNAWLYRFIEYLSRQHCQSLWLGHQAPTPWYQNHLHWQNFPYHQDILSRLQGFQVFSFSEPEENLWKKILKKSFLERGWNVSNRFLKLLYHRLPRNLESLKKMIFWMDQESVQTLSWKNWKQFIDHLGHQENLKITECTNFYPLEKDSIS